ncbi:MAG: HlyD family efflux transporter periplasmic adaptor subunit [bacterium]|nr:HlyD family efflux transporter periplasmic adaptor subunit [bacterium]
MKQQGSRVLITGVLLSAVLSFHCSTAENKTDKVPGVVDGTVITLKSMVAGTLERMSLKEGERVTKENDVARVNSDKIENQLKELDIRTKEIDVKGQKITKKRRFLEANITYLRKQVDRFGRLRAKKAVPGEKLEALELKLMEAETSRFDLNKSMEELEIQKEKIENKRHYLNLLLKDHRMTSPVEGVVVETFVSEGETVFPGTAIADILDGSSLYVEIFIEEGEMAALKLNQEVGIRVDGMDTETGPLTGTISYFGRKAEFSPKYIVSEKERKSLLYQVKIRAKDSKGILKMGMPVTVLLGEK